MKTHGVRVHVHALNSVDGCVRDWSQGDVGIAPSHSRPQRLGAVVALEDAIKA
jgi:hypothetical protein